MDRRSVVNYLNKLDDKVGVFNISLVMHISM
jgi:hypothetical protein